MNPLHLFNRSTPVRCLVCWVLLGFALSQTAFGGMPTDCTALERSDEDIQSQDDRLILIQSVSLLRPVDGTLVASPPTDLIIRNGLIDEVGDDLSSKVSPSTYRFRRPGRWLLPSPVAYVGDSGSDSLHFDDLIHAGLAGFGALVVDADPVHIDIIRKRALLDSKALPDITSRGDMPLPPHALEFTSIDEITLFNGKTPEKEGVVARSSLHPDDPFHPGAPAHFLLLPEDPREHPESISNPDAVLVGGETLLKSERLVRLDEHARFTPDLFSSGEVDSVYEVLIDGIPRDLVRLRITTPGEGRMHLELDGVTTSPITSSTSIRLEWPEGTVTHRATIQNHVFDVSFRSDSSGGTLVVTRDGEPFPESPIQLKAGDRYLPDTLLILFDALLDPTQGKTRRVVELDIYGGPLRVHWSPRHPLRSASSDTAPLASGLTRRELLFLAGAPKGELMTLSSSEDGPALIWVVLDTKRRLVWALYPSPSGMTEWRLKKPMS